MSNKFIINATYLLNFDCISIQISQISEHRLSRSNKWYDLNIYQFAKIEIV